MSSIERSEHRRDPGNLLRHRTQYPGTTDLSFADGEETALGLALHPTPSEDPNDPLRWPKWKKNSILFLVSAYSFLANSTLFGPSIYINYFSQTFQISPSRASQLVSYPNLLFGFGSLVFVPMYHKIGRRPTMLLSLVIFAAGTLGCALSDSFGVLLAFRIIHGFGSSVCEALPAQVVSDIFFLHERGNALGWYTFALSTGSLGAVAGSYMLSANQSFRLYFYISFGLICLLTIGTFFLFEETMYQRQGPGIISRSESADAKVNTVEETLEAQVNEGTENQAMPPRKTFAQQLKPWSHIDPEVSVVMMAVRSFTYFVVPQVFWVISTYGMVIGMAALAFTSTFPILATSPPYNWAPENTGLIAVAAFTGYLLAVVPFHSVPDRITARLTRRNVNIREAEFILWTLLPVALLPPAGLILYGFTAEKQLHWVGFLFAVGMFMFGAYFFMTVTLAYALESYESNVPEMLIAMNLGKQAISFGFGYSVVDWIQAHGMVKIFAVAFCVAMAINNLASILFLAFGKWARIRLANSWLGRWHAATAAH